MLDPMVQSMLSGCTEMVRFDDQLTYARAVGTILGCHQHHFVVIPDAGMGWAIVVSTTAVACLEEHLSLAHMVRTVSDPTHRVYVPEGLDD